MASNGYSRRNWMKMTLLWGTRSYWLLKVTLKQKYRVWNICTSGKTWGYQGFLEFTAHLVYKIYQLNVKCSFLNGELVKEFSCIIVPILCNSKSRGLCISTLQDSQQAQVSYGHGMTLYLNYSLKIMLLIVSLIKLFVL